MKKTALSLLIFAGACGTLSQSESIEPTNFSIKLTRTECYGTCPVYVVEVDPEGKVSFVGLKNTKINLAEDTLSREKLEMLAAEINKADISRFENSYTRSSGNCPTYATDHPTVIFEVTSGQLHKSIEHYLGCSEMKEAHTINYPPGLSHLENKIDEIIGTDRWIK